MKIGGLEIQWNRISPGLFCVGVSGIELGFTGLKHNLAYVQEAL